MMLNYLRQNLKKIDFVFEPIVLAPLIHQAIKKYALFFQKDFATGFGYRLDRYFGSKMADFLSLSSCF